MNRLLARLAHACAQHLDLLLICFLGAAQGALIAAALFGGRP
ncbi:MAG: hypothetical protein ACP5RV_12270 [Thiomonas sp.]